MNITDEMLYQYAWETRDLWLNMFPQQDELPPVSFSKKFKRKMMALTKVANRSPKTNRFFLYLKRSIAAILIVTVLSFCSLMTVKAYREKVIEIVVQVFNELTHYRFVSNAENRELSAVEFGFMPAGMVLSEEIITESSRYVRYENADGKIFELTQISINTYDDFGSILDTEDSVIEVFELRGNEAIANTKHGTTFIFWTEKNEVFELYGNLAADELKRIAENLKISAK